MPENLPQRIEPSGQETDVLAGWQERSAGRSSIPDATDIYAVIPPTKEEILKRLVENSGFVGQDFLFYPVATRLSFFAGAFLDPAELYAAVDLATRGTDFATGRRGAASAFSPRGNNLEFVDFEQKLDRQMYNPIYAGPLIDLMNRYQQGTSFSGSDGSAAAFLPDGHVIEGFLSPYNSGIVVDEPQQSIISESSSLREVEDPLSLAEVMEARHSLRVVRDFGGRDDTVQWGKFLRNPKNRLIAQTYVAYSLRSNPPKGMDRMRALEQALVADVYLRINTRIGYLQGTVLENARETIALEEWGIFIESNERLGRQIIRDKGTDPQLAQVLNSKQKNTS